MDDVEDLSHQPEMLLWDAILILSHLVVPTMVIAEMQPLIVNVKDASIIAIRGGPFLTQMAWVSISLPTFY